MKYLLSLLIITFSTTTSFAQDEDERWNFPQASDYPTVANGAASCTKFTPKGFTVTAKAEGDLNGDRLSDCVLVVRGTAKKFIAKNEGFGSPKFDTNPRILIIAFRNGKGGYKLVEQNNRFIVFPDAPNMTEPFQSIGISKGVLSILIEEFYSAGSWSMTNRTYKFRYQNSEFELIGLEHTHVRRNTGEITTRSYNFSTGKAILSEGMIDDDGKGKKTHYELKLDTPKTLKTTPPAFTWEIENDVVI